MNQKQVKAHVCSLSKVQDVIIPVTPQIPTDSNMNRAVDINKPIAQIRAHSMRTPVDRTTCCVAECCEPVLDKYARNLPTDFSKLRRIGSAKAGTQLLRNISDNNSCLVIKEWRFELRATLVSCSDLECSI